MYRIFRRDFNVIFLTLRNESIVLYYRSLNFSCFVYMIKNRVFIVLQSKYVNIRDF